MPDVISATTGAHPPDIQSRLQRVWGADPATGIGRHHPGEAPRFLEADRMWARVEPHLGDYGITRVAHVTHLDRLGIPVHMAMRPGGRTLSSGSGKGVTEAASALSAVMEAIEQTYWESSRPALRIAPQRELSDESVAFVPIGSLPLTRHQFVSDDLPVAWTLLWDLIAEERVWTPAESVYVPFDDEPRRASGVLASTNGLASGSHAIEAVLAALMEVIERDGVTLGYVLGASERHRVDLTPMPLAAELVDRIERAGAAATVFDVTSDDVAVHTMRAEVVDRRDATIGRFVGYGTSFDPEVATVRAITEAAQSRCIVVAGARDDIFDMQRRSALRLARHDPDVRADPPLARPRGVRSTGSISGDVDLAVSHLQRAGFDRVLVHRYSSEGDPAQVVRVVIPGLEGYKFTHYHPGPRARARLAAQSS